MLQKTIPAIYKKGSREYNKAQLLLNVLLLTSIISLSLTLLGYYISYDLSLIVMPLGAVGFASLTFLVKKNIPLNLVGNIFVVLSSIIIITMITFSGGIYSPVTPWIAAGPTFALLLINRKTAWVWSIIMFAVMATFSIVEVIGKTPLSHYNIEVKATYYFVVYASLIFIMLMVNLIFEKNKNDALLKVEEANKNITASINYARRIQKAILPTATEMTNFFPQHFVLYEPKDIISGDFYWVAESAGKKFIAVADCTGHGVPGALMSMVGNEILNKIVFEKKLSDTDKILNELHSDLCAALRQSSTEVKDGMDIVLCAFSEKEVEFSGAKNALYYTFNGELVSIAANREAIGGDNLNRNFDKHILLKQEGMTFYLCTDGFQDQFGGEKSKKFTVGKLKKTLLDLSQTNIENQKEKLSTTLLDWKKEEEQTDDILVIGVKF
ncbi:MAG: PP2C family protein-serine/threonine phosphatase [Flavobacteriales bacterium]